MTKLIAIRRCYPALRWPFFLHGKMELAPGIRDIAWFDSNGNQIPDESWKDRERRLLCLRRAVRTGEGSISLLSLLLNPTAEDHYFILPAPILGGRILLDSAQPCADEIPVTESKIGVRAHSALLICFKLERPAQ